MSDTHVFQRHELKYLVDNRQRELLEQGFREHMVPDPHDRNTICNVYYDTPDFRLIRHSLEKPVYKEKMRLRSYGQAVPGDLVFLELKKKYKGIVYKRRISIEEQAASAYLAGEGPLENQSQIAKEIAYFRAFYRKLVPAVYLCYDRSAFFSAEDPDLRITFDRNICWRTEDLSLEAPPGGKQILKPSCSLMEIKAASAMPLWLVGILEEGEIRQCSFSKYGMAYRELRTSFGGRACEAGEKEYLTERRGVSCA
ncbi:MAG: polyphosphate polymerase domain-containing protein [Candidatus Limivivens sp.]|nr:polyphosphate polymerase domain-containing protein [Candidatus Limivivens sp.]